MSVTDANANNPTGTDTPLSRHVGTWKLDPEATSVVFHTKAMWFVKVRGTVRAIAGAATVSANGDVSGNLVLDAASFDTGNKKRDTHLRTDDFFDADSFPTVEFVAEQVTMATDGTVTVDGALAMRGETRPFAVAAQITAASDGVDVATSFDIDRREWGVSWAKMGASVATQVEINARFSHQ